MKLFLSLLILFLPQVILAEEHKKITIAEYGEYPLYTALYVAKSKGFFLEQGLDVEIIPAGGDEKVFAALLSGDAQFGVSDPIFTAISGERGMPGKVIAALLVGIPAWGITYKNEISNIENPANLKNYKVGTFPAPSTSYTLQKKMFISAGIKSNIIQLQYGSLLAAMKNGIIDIALENEPIVSQAVKDGAKIIYSMNDRHKEFAFTGLMSLPSYLEKNSDIAQKVVNALVKGNSYIFSNTPEVVTIISKRFPSIDADVLDLAINKVKNEKIFPEVPIFSKLAWDETVSLRKETGDLKSTPLYEDYVIRSFVENAINK